MADDLDDTLEMASESTSPAAQDFFKPPLGPKLFRCTSTPVFNPDCDLESREAHISFGIDANGSGNGTGIRRNAVEIQDHPKKLPSFKKSKSVTLNNFTNSAKLRQLIEAEEDVKMKWDLV